MASSEGVPRWREVHHLALLHCDQDGLGVPHAAIRRQRTSSQFDALLPAFDDKGRLIARDSRWPTADVTPAKRIDITAALREALESIDDFTRAAFVLCDVLELLPEEAAVILEMSPRSVRQNAHQARLLLRDLIDRP